MHTYKVLIRKPECKKENSQSGSGWEENIKQGQKNSQKGVHRVQLAYNRILQWVFVNITTNLHVPKMQKIDYLNYICVLKKGSTPCI
jgi:hypothetical protein